MYFQSPSGDAEVRGAELYYFKWLCNRTLLTILDLGSDKESEPHPLRHAFPAGHYTAQYRGREWAAIAEIAIVTWSISDDDSLTIGDRRSSFVTAALNTALAIGGDQLKLAARLYWQCEIHAFVEGSNRAWLANIIEGGLRLGIFRTNSGWKDVVKLLRFSSDEPVVTAYSGVCDDKFPSLEVAIQASVWSLPEKDEDAWYKLPASEQWRLAMDALRIQNQSGYGIELKPDDWEHYRFGDGVTAFGIMNHFSSLVVPNSR